MRAHTKRVQLLEIFTRATSRNSLNHIILYSVMESSVNYSMKENLLALEFNSKFVKIRNESGKGEGGTLFEINSCLNLNLNKDIGSML